MSICRGQYSCEEYIQREEKKREEKRKGNELGFG
jgi:hypothetical protein